MPTNSDIWLAPQSQPRSGPSLKHQVKEDGTLMFCSAEQFNNIFSPLEIYMNIYFILNMFDGLGKMYCLVSVKYVIEYPNQCSSQVT